MTIKLQYRRIEARSRIRLFRCRCSRCEKRTTLKRNPRLAEKPLVCVCGSQRWRVDWYRTIKTEHRRVRCDCGGWEFPHRAGSCHQQRARIGVAA